MGSTENKQYAVLIQYLEENQERFYRVAFSYAKNREAALDLVQDAIVKAISNFSSLKKQEYLKTWFYRTLKRDMRISNCMRRLGALLRN